MAGMGLPGALVGKTLMTGSDSKAKIIWRLLHSCIWYLGCNDSRAGLSELGPHMASPCGLGIVTAWWSQGSQFLKWGPGFQKQVPSEQEKSCMAFFCLVFFPFNNLMEIIVYIPYNFPIQNVPFSSFNVLRVFQPSLQSTSEHFNCPPKETAH